MNGHQCLIRLHDLPARQITITSCEPEPVFTRRRHPGGPSPHPAPTVLVPLAERAGVAVPLEPGPACLLGARGDPGAGGQALAGLPQAAPLAAVRHLRARDRKSTRLNSSHLVISYAVFCLKKKK